MDRSTPISPHQYNAEVERSPAKLRLVSLSTVTPCRQLHGCARRSADRLRVVCSTGSCWLSRRELFLSQGASRGVLIFCSKACTRAAAPAWWKTLISPCRRDKSDRRSFGQQA